MLGVTLFAGGGKPQLGSNARRTVSKKTSNFLAGIDFQPLPEPDSTTPISLEKYIVPQSQLHRLHHLLYSAANLRYMVNRWDTLACVHDHLCALDIVTCYPSMPDHPDSAQTPDSMPVDSASPSDQKSVVRCIPLGPY